MLGMSWQPMNLGPLILKLLGDSSGLTWEAEWGAAGVFRILGLGARVLSWGQQFPWPFLQDLPLKELLWNSFPVQTSAYPGIYFQCFIIEYTGSCEPCFGAWLPSVTASNAAEAGSSRKFLTKEAVFCLNKHANFPLSSLMIAVTRHPTCRAPRYAKDTTPYNIDLSSVL